MSEIVTSFNLLPNLSADLRQAVQLALNDAASQLAGRAQHMVDQGYPPASAPGDPPHKRTGDLEMSIEAVPNAGELEADVRAGGGHALYLEYGTAHMAARPFMAPAANAATPEIEALLERAVLGKVVGP